MNSLLKSLSCLLLLSIAVEGYHIKSAKGLVNPEKIVEKSQESKLGILLNTNIFHDNIGDFYKGAHIVFEDGGRFFEEVIQCLQPAHDMRSRFSLHYSVFDKQYSFQVPSLNLEEVLIGKAENQNGHMISWIQAEKHSLRTLHQKYWHSIDTILYIAMMQSYNIGPLGVSAYTSSNPLIIGPR